MATLGWPATSVAIQTGGIKQGGPAIPVYVVTDGRAVEGGPAQAVYVVTSGPVQGGPALPCIIATGVQAGHILAGPAIPVYVVSGSLITAATFASGEVGSVAADTVVVNWTAAIMSPLNDYTLGVTIKVNGIAATISSASRPSTTQTRSVLSAPVVAGDVITWEYDSGPGDLQTIATGVDVATIGAQSITNSLTSGHSLDFSQATNSMYVPWAF